MNGRSRASLASEGPAFTRPTGRRRLRWWTRPGTSTASPCGYVSRSTRWPSSQSARVMARTANGVPRTSKNGCGARNRMRSGGWSGVRGGLLMVGVLGLMRQETLRVDGGHAPASGGGDRLPVAVIGDIARGVDPGHVGGGAPVAVHQVAGPVGVEHAGDEGRVGFVADGHEDAARGHLAGRARLQVA